MAFVEVGLDSDLLVLDPDCAVCTIVDCLENTAITGPFDNYLYCAANGRQVLLGSESSLG
jgi:hypothetical protein